MHSAKTTWIRNLSARGCLRGSPSPAASCRKSDLPATLLSVERTSSEFEIFFCRLQTEAVKKESEKRMACMLIVAAFSFNNLHLQEKVLIWLFSALPISEMPFTKLRAK